jgi:hypothetical protein
MTLLLLIALGLAAALILAALRWMGRPVWHELRALLRDFRWYGW